MLGRCRADLPFGQLRFFPEFYSLPSIQYVPILRLSGGACGALLNARAILPHAPLFSMLMLLASVVSSALDGLQRFESSWINGHRR